MPIAFPVGSSSIMHVPATAPRPMKSVQNKSGQRNHRETVVESSVLSGFQQLLGIARTVREPSVDKVHQVDESLDEEKVA